MRSAEEALDSSFERYEPSAETVEDAEWLALRRPPALHVERVEAADLVRYQAAWADLCARAIEPNIFLDPDFLLPLLQHAASARRPSVLLVWAENGRASFGRLLGLFPLHLGRRRSPRGGIVHGFAHNQTSSGVPLVDRDLAPETIDAALAWLGRSDARRYGALVLTNIAADGPFKAALDAAAVGAGRSTLTLDTHSRAILRHDLYRGERSVVCASAKRRKERARQSRRLSEVGARRYTSARTVSAVAAATERFLALEHSGWKGARGTSLLATPKLATFCRTMTRSMAAAGKCRIDAIEIDGRPVAMGIVMRSGDRSYFWKTSFDEALGSLSPGVQFALDLTGAQIADPTLAMTDSCAVADHPMIDRLWPHRISMVDVMIPLEPGMPGRLSRYRALELARRAIRTRMKTVYTRCRRLVAGDWRAAAGCRSPWETRSHRSAMEQERQRIDKWLWFARVVKSRTLAAGLVEEGHVRVNGQRVTIAARPISAGDVLTIALERRVRVLRVVGVGDRRGPFAEARLLFDDLTASGAG